MYCYILSFSSSYVILRCNRRNLPFLLPPPFCVLGLSFCRCLRLFSHPVLLASRSCLVVVSKNSKNINRRTFSFSLRRQSSPCVLYTFPPYRSASYCVYGCYFCISHIVFLSLRRPCFPSPSPCVRHPEMSSEE